MKTCSACGQTLPLSSFPVRKSSRDGLGYSCRDCKNAQNKSHYAANKAALPALRSRQVQRMRRVRGLCQRPGGRTPEGGGVSGISLRPTKDVLWDAQEGACWICGHRMLLGGRQHHQQATLDHVFPRSKFRAMGDIGIVLLAHKGCNGRRGDPWPTDDELRELVRVWRRVDRSWLNANLALIHKNLTALKTQASRAELLAIFAGAAA